jgi:hypothetical protein
LVLELKLDWCTKKAASYACRNYHYSGGMPSGKLVCIGVWEDSRFIGAIVYGLGANDKFSRAWGLKTTEVCELSRVALGKHEATVTKMIAISLKMLRRFCPGIKVVVSYADLDQGHDGVIYRAGNWKMEKKINRPHLVIRGVQVHPRTVVARYGTMSLPWLKKNVDSGAHFRKTKGKIRYSYRLR